MGDFFSFTTGSMCPILGMNDDSLRSSSELPIPGPGKVLSPSGLAWVTRGGSLDAGGMILGAFKTT